MRLGKIEPPIEEPCSDPVVLPDRDLTNEDIARLWGTDRKRLATCRDRHGALVIVIKTERDALTKE